MKKKVLVPLLLCAFLLSGCGDGGGASEEPNSYSVLGDFYVEYRDAALGEDLDGAPVIVVTYYWENNSEETTSASMTVECSLFQDGVSLSDALFVSDEYCDYDNYWADVRPGAGVEVQEAFELGDLSSEVEIEITLSPFAGEDDGRAYVLVDPAQLGGGQGEDAPPAVEPGILRTPEPEPEQPAREMTPTQAEAVDSAKSYLSFMSFSYAGLVDQLEYEGFSTADAEFAADNCGADWYEQAVLKAQSYLDSMPFSYTGLVDQLEYEGFLPAEAVYGVDHCGADWYEQAALKAEDYLEIFDFSRAELIDQLEFVGFTQSEAEYAAGAVGLY